MVECLLHQVKVQCSIAMAEHYLLSTFVPQFTDQVGQLLFTAAPSALR
jgi:hypothetical protein